MGCSCPIRWKETMIFGSSTWSFIMIILDDGDGDVEEEEEEKDNDENGGVGNDDDGGCVDDCFSPPEC